MAAGVVLMLAVVIGTGAIIVIPKQMRADRLHANLPSIHPGMTEAEVVRLVGPPDQAVPCEPKRDSCKSVYHYDVPLQIAGEVWWVRFDGRGRVAYTRSFVSQ